MLLKVPGAKEWNQSKKEAVELYAKERHLPYLDLNKLLNSGKTISIHF